MCWRLFLKHTFRLFVSLSNSVIVFVHFFVSLEENKQIFCLFWVKKAVLKHFWGFTTEDKNFRISWNNKYARVHLFIFFFGLFWKILIN